MLNTNERDANFFLKKWAAGLLAVVVVIAVGCAPPAEKESSGPSYADLVVTYNAECDALDRLEGKQLELVRRIAAVGSGAEGSALETLNAFIESTQASVDKIGGDLPADPHAALDQAVERAEATQQATQSLLEAATSAAGDRELSAEEEAEQQKLMDDLAEIEKDIVAQKQRVERAREDRDAAEAERQ